MRLLFFFPLRHRVHLGSPGSSQLLGPGVRDVCFPPLLPDSRGDHQRVLQPHGEASPQRSHPVGIQGERSQPSAHHAYGVGGSRGFRCMLDAHPDHGPGAVAGLQLGQRPDGGVYALLHCPWLRQQQP